MPENVTPLPWPEHGTVFFGQKDYHKQKDVADDYAYARRCVHSHDALVGALKLAYRFLDPNERVKPQMTHVIEHLRVVLRDAGVEP